MKKKLAVTMIAAALMASVCSCGSSKKAETTAAVTTMEETTTAPETTKAPETTTAAPETTAAPTTAAPTTAAPTTAAPTSAAASDTVTPEFKEAMDSYEAFFDGYIEFMKKYAASGNDVTMLTDYASWMSQYAEMMAKMEAIDESKLSTADDLYYVEVNARITQKLLEVAQ